MKLKKNFIKFFFSLIILFTPINETFSIEPTEFVQLTVDKASEALDNKYSKEEKVKKLKDIAKESVDIKGIGYYSLGSYRKNLSDDKKKEYLIIFEKYFLKSFSSRLAEYSDPKIKVDSQKKIK